MISLPWESDPITSAITESEFVFDGLALVVFGAGWKCVGVGVAGTFINSFKFRARVESVGFSRVTSSGWGNSSTIRGGEIVNAMVSGVAMAVGFGAEDCVTMLELLFAVEGVVFAVEAGDDSEVGGNSRWREFLNSRAKI